MPSLNKDKALIIGLTPFGESKLLVHAFTEGEGKVTGLMRRNKNPLKAITPDIGMWCQLSWREKETSSLPWFTFELITGYGAAYLYEPLKLLQLQSLCAILNKVLPDREAHNALFTKTAALLPVLNLEHYTNWEITLLKELGFEVVWNTCAVTGQQENLTHVSPKTGRAVCAEAAQPYGNKLLAMPQSAQESLQVTGYFLEKWLFNENPKGLPLPRRQLSAAALEF